MDYQGVALAADTTESTVIYVLKQIAAAVFQSVNNSHSVKLNMRVGWLKFINKRVFFDKLANKDQPDASSCRTSFYQKKKFMTNLIRLEENDRPMSIRDTISLASGRTPCTRRTRGAKSMAFSSHGGGSTNASTYHAANPNP